MKSCSGCDGQGSVVRHYVSQIAYSIVHLYIHVHVHVHVSILTHGFRVYAGILVYSTMYMYLRVFGTMYVWC